MRERPLIAEFVQLGVIVLARTRRRPLDLEQTIAVMPLGKERTVAKRHDVRDHAEFCAKSQDRQA
jgi:hypothetical protein